MSSKTKLAQLHAGYSSRSFCSSQKWMAVPSLRFTVSSLQERMSILAAATMSPRLNSYAVFTLVKIYGLGEGFS